MPGECLMGHKKSVRTSVMRRGFLKNTLCICFVNTCRLRVNCRAHCVALGQEARVQYDEVKKCEIEAEMSTTRSIHNKMSPPNTVLW